MEWLKNQIPIRLAKNTSQGDSQPSRSAMQDCSQRESALENLPPELRTQILLQLPDVQSLRSLVHASPSYHATYRAAGRGRVMRRLALQQLDFRVRADALAASRSGRFYRLELITDREKKRTSAFIDEYACVRGGSATTSIEWLSCRDMTEAQDLVHLNKACKKILAEYCRSVAAEMHQEQQFLLSSIEQLRLERAIYRFQTYCNFFGRNTSLRNDDRSEHPIKRYLPSFPPWEVMEIACVWHYLMERWVSIFREVLDTKLMTREERREPDISHALRNEREVCEYLVHRGPRFLAEFPAKRKSPRDVIKNIFPEPLVQPFGKFEQLTRPGQGFIHPANKYLEPDSPAQFSSMAEPEQPSRGWEWFCDTHKIRSLGLGVEVWPGEARKSIKQRNKPDLRWGFPFWDKEKLEAWGMIRARDDAHTDGGHAADASTEGSP